MTEVTVQIIAPHFTAAIVAQYHPHDVPVVVRAAPILKYMIGWGGQRVADYCSQKGWAWQRVEVPR